MKKLTSRGGWGEWFFCSRARRSSCWRRFFIRTRWIQHNKDKVRGKWHWCALTYELFDVAGDVGVNIAMHSKANGFCFCVRWVGWIWPGWIQAERHDSILAGLFLRLFRSQNHATPARGQLEYNSNKKFLSSEIVWRNYFQASDWPAETISATGTNMQWTPTWQGKRY